MKKNYLRLCEELNRMRKCGFVALATLLNSFLLVGVLSAQTSGPNCANLNLSVGSNDSSTVQVSELVTNSSVATPVNIRVENRFGGIIYIANGLSASDEITLPGCELEGQTLRVDISNSISRCWSEITFKVNSSYSLQSNLDTTVWCNDPIAFLDPNNLRSTGWYTTTFPFTLLPTAIVACDDDKVLNNLTDINHDGRVNAADARDFYAPLFEECNYESIDWTETPACSSDTATIIIREWYAFDDKGFQSTTTDTIRLIKIPDLTQSGYIDAPQKDTIFCELETRTSRTYTTKYLCWKQLVGLHSDGTYIYYPKEETDEVIATALTNSQQEAELKKKTVIFDRNNNGTFNEINLFEIATFAVETGPYGKPSYVFKVRSGDQILSNEGSYITVDANWFYSAGGHGFWIDLCIPYIEVRTSSVTCDVWPAWECARGVQVLLPNLPYNSDTCAVLCLDNDALTGTKCGVTMKSSIHNHFYGCPQSIKYDFEIKQTCYSTGTDDILEVPCAREADTTGIVSIDETNHIIKVEQWKILIDEIGPLYRGVSGTTTWSTGIKDCIAEVRAPSVTFKDDCSGVKRVKANVNNLGWINLERDGDRWYHSENSRTFNLSCGTFTVTYEATDSCHNKTTITPNVRIVVVDRQVPTVVLDDRRQVSLGGKTAWVSAESFDEGSYDNCGIRMTLARRLDWKESCGVDLCSAELASLTTEAEVDAFIRSNGILATLGDSDIERHYRDSYEWLRDDGEWCDDKDNYVLEGWAQEIKQYWLDNCIEKHHYHNSGNSTFSIGGGWGESVPFCCEDACSEVQVEILVIDKDCNYGKGWVTVSVEDKSPVSPACYFDEITISCSSYKEIYEADINAAIAAGNNSMTAEEEFAAVDEQLGALLKGWDDGSGNFVDDNGNLINKEFTFITDECKYEIEKRQVAVKDHDGSESYVWVEDTVVVIEKQEKTADMGGVFVLCNATCKQDIWPVLNDCGVGTITRRWEVYSGCGTHANPLKFEQKINVVAGCELKKFMFEVPQDDTVICEKLSFDAQGNVAVDAGELLYTLEDFNCRELGLGYRDEVFEVIDEPGVYKVHRTWTAKDWCSGDEITCLQKIILNTECEDDTVNSSVAGQIVTSYDAGRIQNVSVQGALAGGEVLTATTGALGSYSFDVNGGEALTITPVKDYDHTNGVDILDILAIQDHILGRRTIEGQYRLIAADANNDGVINSKDITTIQRVSLMKDDEFFGNSSWRFFSQVSGEESIVVNDFSDAVTANFIGVKIGDVDQEGVNLARSARELNLTTQDLSLQAGQTVRLSLESPAALEAFQFAVKYNPSALKVNLVDLSTDNWNQLQEGVILVAALADGASSAITLDVTALTDVALSEALTVGGQSGLSSLGYSSDMGVVSLGLAFTSGEGGFALYQNTPNPFASQSSLSFNMPEASSATLTFFDVTGKVVHQIQGNYGAGLNSIEVTAADLNTTGVIYYQLETEKFTASRRMVILED